MYHNFDQIIIYSVIVFGVFDEVTAKISRINDALDLEKHLTLLSDDQPRSAPALELVVLPRSGEPHISRATSSVGVMYCVLVSTQGVIPGGRIQNK